MGVYSNFFGSVNGKDVYLFKIQNNNGNYVEFINFGATIVSIFIPDLSGKLENVVLSHPTLDKYLADQSYLGSTIGRIANRVSNGCFSMNNQVYDLDKNDGKHSNHGGFNGLNQKIFDFEILENAIRFSVLSADGEDGLPGNLQLDVIYSFSDENELAISYRALSDKKTPINITNHVYFNLNPSITTILNHELKIFAEKYLDSLNDFIPTGEIILIKEGAYDFRDYNKIGSGMKLKSTPLKGYNTYFITDSTLEMKKLASARESISGRRLDLYSTMPGVLFYSGDFLDGAHKPFQGFCLEAQYPPDFVNNEKFASCYLEPQQIFQKKIVYKFFL